MAGRGIRRRTGGVLGVLSVLALVASGCAADPVVEIGGPEQAQEALPAETVASIDAAVANALAASKAPGAIVGVWSPWSGSYVQATGTDAAGAALSTDMTFRVSDVTRLMTCDVMYAIAAEGKLSVDDAVSDWVAGFPTLADVTLLELCNGTSGLGSYQGLLQPSWIINPDRQWSPTEIASFGIGDRVVDPGVTYSDSDSGYMLLGLALERATGMSAAALFDQYIFTPLGLADTALPGSSPALPSPRGSNLIGYEFGRTAEGAIDCAAPIDVTKRSASIGFTDSGVVSTVDDLGRYMKAVAAGTLAHEGDDRWSAPLPGLNGGPAWYTATGGGIVASTLIGQFGYIPGYVTAAYADPATGMTVVVVLNNSTAGPWVAQNLAWELAAIASKAPAAAGFTTPEFGLPWTAEKYHQEIAAATICG